MLCVQRSSGGVLLHGVRLNVSHGNHLSDLAQST